MLCVGRRAVLSQTICGQWLPLGWHVVVEGQYCPRPFLVEWLPLGARRSQLQTEAGRKLNNGRLQLLGSQAGKGGNDEWPS